ncbi:MAG: hypothetical protein K8T91_07795 [Planctomycetes bacterium]|nr:hypothetical protein [Planctomycetota bacterium]
MTSQPLGAATSKYTEPQRKPFTRKRVAIVAGLAATVWTALILAISQKLGASDFNHVPAKTTYAEVIGYRHTPEYSYWTIIKAGWPVTYYVNNLNGNGIKVDYGAIYIDTILCVLLTIGAGIGMGRLVWCFRWPPQFSMRAMFNWTLVVAILLGVVPAYLRLSTLLHHDVSSIVPITALFALALTLFAASWTVLFTARWLLKMRKCSS